jgi:regulatory protein
MELALRALGRKERTVAELGEWLRARGVEAAEAEEVVERLLGTGTLDDERFARRYAEDKRDLAGWGPERIRRALLARGVDGELVEAALSAEGQSEQVERAASLLERQGADVSSDVARGRALALLARRGFPLEVAYEAVRVRERGS